MTLASIHIGTPENAHLVNAVWNGKQWSFQDLRRPKKLDSQIWETEKRASIGDFLVTSLDTVSELVDAESSPFPLDPVQNAAAATMINHENKGLGKIVKEIPEDILYMLE